MGKDSAETSLPELGPWREAVRAKSPLLCPERTGLDFLSGAVSLRTERGILQHTLQGVQQMARAGCAATSNSPPSSSHVLSSLTLTPALPGVAILNFQTGKWRLVTCLWTGSR